MEHADAEELIEDEGRFLRNWWLPETLDKMMTLESILDRTDPEEVRSRSPRALFQESGIIICSQGMPPRRLSMVPVLSLSVACNVILSVLEHLSLLEAIALTRGRTLTLTLTLTLILTVGDR